MAKTFPRPLSTIDVVMFTLIKNRLHVLLPVRDNNPCKGLRALVGGVIHINEDLDTHGAARRVALQKIGIDVSHMEQLAVFSGPDRDPRGWSLSIAYLAMVRSDALAPALLEDFFPVDMLPEQLAFDHKMIVQAGTARMRNKASYSTLPLFLMDKEFTMFDLQQVYEALMGQEINKDSFRRKIQDLEIIEPTGKMSDPKVTKTRPAELFRTIGNRIWFFEELG
jgi:8-oxo-dGTP diphosphatase